MFSSRFLSYKAILISGLIFCNVISYAQTSPKSDKPDQNPFNTVTGGLTIKPIFPTKTFGNGSVLMDTANVKFSILPQVSYCAGAVIRRSFTKLFAVETGLNFNRRIYNMNVVDTNNTTTTIRYRFIGFEIPVQALVFVRLSDKVFSNLAAGASLDIYPSDILVKGGELYRVGGLKNGLFGGTILLNLGLEYRTKEDGIIYVGATYHRPFSSIFYNEITWDLKSNGRNLQKGTNIGGGYFALDIRYYIQPTLIVKKAKRKKKGGSKEITY